jgi:serine/threonine protein kinase
VAAEPLNCSVAKSTFTVSKYRTVVSLTTHSCSLLGSCSHASFYTHSLQHDHILNFSGYYEDPTHISLVLEYCALGDLVSHMQHWRGRQQRLERCRLYLRQVTAALAYLDQLQVAHRDLKPENILVLTDRDTVKLCDFGWAVWWQPGQFQRTLCGTAEYVVPEMLQGSKDERMYRAEFVDPWALGILAIELFLGVTPFCMTELDLEAEKNEQEIIFEKIRRFSGMAKIIPANEMADKEMSSFWDLVSRLVQIEPESRISASEALKHAFLCPHDATTMTTDTGSSAWTNLRPTVAQRCQIFQQSTMTSSSARI